MRAHVCAGGREQELPQRLCGSLPRPRAGPASGASSGPGGSRCARGCWASLAGNKVCCAGGQTPWLQLGVSCDALGSVRRGSR